MSKKKKKKRNKEKRREFAGAQVIEIINSVHFLYEKKLDTTFNDLGLSTEQFRILRILRSAPADGYSLRDIREFLPNKTSNATRLVGKLGAKGLLTKKGSNSDKRQLRITLTEAGQEVLRAAQVKIDELDHSMTSVLRSKSVRELAESLSYIASALN